MAESALAARIGKIVREVGRVDAGRAIAPEARLVEDLGIDSLDLVGVFLEIQDQFGIEFDDAEITGLTRVGDVVACVARRRPDADPGHVASSAA